MKSHYRSKKFPQRLKQILEHVGRKKMPVITESNKVLTGVEQVLLARTRGQETIQVLVVDEAKLNRLIKNFK